MARVTTNQSLEVSLTKRDFFSRSSNWSMASWIEFYRWDWMWIHCLLVQSEKVGKRPNRFVDSIPPPLHYASFLFPWYKCSSYSRKWRKNKLLKWWGFLESGENQQLLHLFEGKRFWSWESIDQWVLRRIKLVNTRMLSSWWRKSSSQQKVNWMVYLIKWYNWGRNESKVRTAAENIYWFSRICHETVWW